MLAHFSITTRKQRWPNPPQSLGPACMKISGQSCWLVAGPALELYRSLEQQINDLLERHKELIEQGESKPSMTSWNMWMIGNDAETAQPTIVFASKSRRQRQCAKAFLKDSKILDETPYVRIKTLAKSPAELRCAQSSDSSLTEGDSNEGVFLVNESDELSGSLIAVDDKNLATLGGIVKLKNRCYGFTAYHASIDFCEDEDAIVTNSCTFDDDSDVDEDDLVELTSRGSESDGEERHSFSDLPSYTTTDSEVLHTCEGASTSTLETAKAQQTEIEPVVERKALPLSSHICMKRKISINAEKVTNAELDYMCFEIDRAECDIKTKAPCINTEALEYQTCLKVADSPASREVYALAGKSGLMEGTLFEAPYYVKMASSARFQELWTVRFEKNTSQGDCGTWVIDSSSGLLYGHIIAGDSQTGLSYIIPAYKTAAALETQCGETPCFMLPKMLSIHSIKVNSSTRFPLSRPLSADVSSSAEPFKGIRRTSSRSKSESILPTKAQAGEIFNRILQKVDSGVWVSQILSQDASTSSPAFRSSLACIIAEDLNRTTWITRWFFFDILGTGGEYNRFAESIWIVPQWSFSLRASSPFLLCPTRYPTPTEGEEGQKEESGIDEDESVCSDEYNRAVESGAIDQDSINDDEWISQFSYQSRRSEMTAWFYDAPKVERLLFTADRKHNRRWAELMGEMEKFFITELVGLGALKLTFPPTHQEEWDAISWSAKYGFTRPTELQLHKGAKVMNTKPSGVSARDTAILPPSPHGLEILHLLLSRDGDLDFETKNAVPAFQEWLSEDADTERVREMLGVSRSLTKQKGKWNALLYAACFWSEHAALDKPTARVKVTDKEDIVRGYTALHADALLCHMTAVAILLKNGADPNRADAYLTERYVFNEVDSYWSTLVWLIREQTKNKARGKRGRRWTWYKADLAAVHPDDPRKGGGPSQLQKED